MGTEIERKWLVPVFPEEFDGLSGERIMQGYLAVAEDGTEVRIRNKHDRYVLTVKSGAGLVRSETEIELSSEQFWQLWEVTEGRRIAKHRVNLEGGVDVDIYDGKLTGLIVAEVEFESEAAAAAFETPRWFGEEVTEDRAYKNQQLALHGRPDA